MKQTIDVVLTLLAALRETYVETLIIYKLGFNKKYCTFTGILLIKIVLYSKLY